MTCDSQIGTRFSQGRTLSKFRDARSFFATGTFLCDPRCNFTVPRRDDVTGLRTNCGSSFLCVVAVKVRCHRCEIHMSMSDLSFGIIQRVVTLITFKPSLFSLAFSICAFVVRSRVGLDRLGFSPDEASARAKK